MFEKAFRMKLRFDSPQGQLTVEDLFDLPLTAKTANRANLDDIACTLHAALQDSSPVSFVEEKSSKNETLELKFEIVKYIIAVRKQENEAKLKLVEKREQKQQLLALLNEKENEALRNLSVEEIRKRIEEL